MAITAFLSRSPGLLNRGPRVPASLGAGSLYRIFSPTGLISNWLNFLCTELYNCSTPTFFLWASQIALNSTSPWSKLYPDIPWPGAPVIYTGEFPILTAWLGWRSICNSWVSWHINLCRLFNAKSIFMSVVLFQNFSLVWVHSLYVKNISISSYSVYSNSPNSDKYKYRFC